MRKNSKTSKIADPENTSPNQKILNRFDNARKQQSKAVEKRGRPTIYTDELGERICQAIENSPRGIRWICENNAEFPVSETVRDWLNKNTYPIFSARYTQARRNQAAFISDEITDVAYDYSPDKFGRVEHPKLIVDALKWKAKILQPRVYGDDPAKYIEAKDDSVSSTTKETLKDRLGKLGGLLARKKKIEESGDKE